MAKVCLPLRGFLSALLFLSSPRVLFALGVSALIGILTVRCLHKLLQLLFKTQIT